MCLMHDSFNKYKNVFELKQKDHATRIDYKTCFNITGHSCNKNETCEMQSSILLKANA